jgi:NAD-dependent deacetylase
MIYTKELVLKRNSSSRRTEKSTFCKNETKIYDWEEDCNLGDCDELGNQLRPHIVWFGEMVPEMDNATEIASEADIFIVIGTSMQVYPAAGLIHYVPKNCEIYVIDPHLENQFTKHENFLKTSATEGMKILKRKLLK